MCDNDGLLVSHFHNRTKRPFGLLKKPLMPKETLRRNRLDDDFSILQEINLYQRFRVKLFGDVFLYRTRPQGFSNAVPIHVVNCSRHGLYLDTPHENSKYFQCPDCLSEVLKKEADKRKKITN